MIPATGERLWRERSGAANAIASTMPGTVEQIVMLPFACGGALIGSSLAWAIR